jgi:two-component system NtrC family sensor kinase
VNSRGDTEPAGGRRIRNHLAYRLGIRLFLGAAVILLGVGTWNLHLQRNHLTGLVGASADRIAETIRRTTREGMMRDSAEDVHRMIETIGAQQGITRIRILNKEGHIRYSTRVEEVGTFVDKSAEQCYACHQRDQPLDRLERADRIRTFRASSGEGILGIIAPIQNEPECSTAACHVHDPDQSVLGILDVQLSLATVDAELAASETQMLVSLVVTGIAVLLFAGSLTWRLVLRPVRRLTRATGRVAGGDLSTQVAVSSSDEIGQLMNSWNDMTLKLKQAYDQLEEYGRTLEKRVQEKTEELENAHQRMLLVEKMASLGKLAAVVAHEINNPLAGIRTYAKLLRRRSSKDRTGGEAAVPVDPDTERILQFVEDEASRCGEIVRNLLLFSRVQGARFSTEPLKPLLERCIFLIRHQAELNDVDLSLEVADDLPPICCDPSQVQQMILALAMNAIEATPKEGSVRITANPWHLPEGVMLEVIDTGCGIPPEHQAKIFEPFFTTKDSGSGVGLGLAVVYGIINRHHGKIEVHSTPGSGTTFTIILPLDQPASREEDPGEPLEVSR